MNDSYESNFLCCIAGNQSNNKIHSEDKLISKTKFQKKVIEYKNKKKDKKNLTAQRITEFKNNYSNLEHGGNPEH